MATPFVPGPCLIYAGISSGFQPVFFGTAEVTPVLQLNPKFTPFMNSLSGVELPQDFTYQGEHALISADINRMNLLVYNAMAQRTRLALAGSVRGRDAVGDRGTMMVGEGAAFPLWLRFPYGDKAIYSALGLNKPEPGYRFISAFLMGPDVHKPINTTPRTIQCVWYCMSPYAPSTGEHILYDLDMTGLPAAD